MDEQGTGRLEEARVLDQVSVGGAYYRLTLQAPGVAAAAQPGQFVHLRVPGLEAHVLRRPFSIYQVRKGDVDILYKTVGTGTRAMLALRAGDAVSLMGPLGRGFPLDRPGPPLLIGGGYGAAPLRFLAERLPRRGIVFLGGRSEGDLLCREEFRALHWEVQEATEDGSAGRQGRVTDLLDAWLEARPDLKPEPEIFACGPDGMLQAVSERAAARHLHAWLSMDRHMGCGAGVCLACVIRVRRNATEGGSAWARVCKDGPVFESRDIVWSSESLP